MAVPRPNQSGSLIQSNFGSKGNFELVVPQSNGKIAHYYRDNDDPNIPWHRTVEFGDPNKKYQYTSLIQSNFGSKGNFEVITVNSNNRSIEHYYRDNDNTA